MHWKNVVQSIRSFMKMKGIFTSIQKSARTDNCVHRARENSAALGGNSKSSALFINLLKHLKPRIDEQKLSH